MKDLKLEHHHLKNYLGTGLELELSGYNNPKRGFMFGINTRNDRVIYTAHSGMIEDDIKIHFCKPIMYRLSDLDEYIPEFGFIPRDKIPMGDVMIESGKIYASGDEWDYSVLPVYTFEWLVNNKFWVFGDEYFEEGLLINKLKDI